MAKIKRLIKQRSTLRPLERKQCLDIFWEIFLDSRAFFGNSSDNPASGLDALVACLGQGDITTLLYVPYSELSAGQSPHDSGVDTTYEPAQKKPKTAAEGGMPAKTGYGRVMIPCTTLVTQWAKTQKVIPGVLVKDVLAVAKRENGTHPWTIKSRTCPPGGWRLIL